MLNAKLQDYDESYSVLERGCGMSSSLNVTTSMSTTTWLSLGGLEGAAMPRYPLAQCHDGNSFLSTTEWRLARNAGEKLDDWKWMMQYGAESKVSDTTMNEKWQVGT